MDPAAAAAAADRASLLESLAARLERATAKLPPPPANGEHANGDAASAAASDPDRPSPLEIGDLVSCCDAILPFFDHLGPVFQVARGEFGSKVQAIRAAGPSSHPLRELVAADVAAKKATTKGSATRSLHRLGGTLLFIKVLFERLLITGGGMHHHNSPEGGGRSPRPSSAAADGGNGGGGGAATTAASPAEGDGYGSGFAGMVRRLSGAGSHGLQGSTLVTLREAASEAYEKALAPWHTLMIKGVVRAGMLTLPSRETFLAACGETEASARPHAGQAVKAAQRLLSEIEHLLRGIKMPASDVWLWPG